MIKNRKVIIGLAVSVTIACGAGYAVAGSVKPHGESGYCADMSDAVGLYDGNPVTQMGYQVGRIDHVRPDGDHVRVTFTLDAGRQFPIDVKAVTRSKSLLADRSLELVGNYRSGPRLTPGACIAAGNTYTPKSISEITGSAADFIDAIAPADGKQSFEAAVAGLDQALRGTGEPAHAMLTHASAALSSPDQMIADFGTTIMNMAPLTTEALQRWSTIRSILDQMTTVVAYGSPLFSSVVNVTVGVGWLVNTLYDIQSHYGDLIWPLMNGGVAAAIHLAATRSKDIRSLLSVVPSVAGLLRQESAGSSGLTLAYRPPTMLDLVLAKGK